MSLATPTKTRPYHKKRTAEHHRHSKKYLKTYWPYLPMLGIVGLGIIINSLWTFSSGHVLGVQTNFNQSTLMSLTNAQRARYDEAPLSLNNDLANAAQTKADQMVKENYWGHVSPEGQQPSSFVIDSGYQFEATGENLAYGFSNASAVIGAWMKSTEHRANMLNIDYQAAGFGVAESKDYIGQGPEIVVVAEYAQPAGAVGPVNTNTLSAPPAQPVTRLQLLTNYQAGWPVLTLILTASAAAMLSFVIRHSRQLHKAAVKGELFIIKHPKIDTFIVAFCTVSVLLSHTIGHIA